MELEQIIQFNSVSFRYGPQSPEVLSGLTLNIRKGEHIGLVGKTGSGKSTLIDLLMGLLVPSSGKLLVDGMDIHDSNYPERLFSWRSAIAHVPQSIYLSDGSIAENIAFGIPKHQIDMERVRDAAQHAQISSFIENCKDGYNSFVGERGVRLSGGQQQRIGIARALYKKAKVLIFDEATSALDNETESYLIDSLQTLSKDITIVMVAHRISSLANCDKIITVERGQVIFT